MAYRIREGESISKGIKRLVRQQLDRASKELADPELDVHESVHQARKRFKKIRAALRLVRGAIGETYKEENAFYRDAGRRLAPARDMEVIVETYAKLRDVFPDPLQTERFGRIADALTGRRDELTAGSDIDAAAKEVIEALQDARKRVKAWSVSGSGFEPAADGLTKTYRRGRKAMRKLADRRDSQDEASLATGYHDWRKRAKYHRYQVRILQNIWSPLMKARRREMHRLTDLLGEHHDLSMLRGVICGEPSRFGGQADVQTIVELIRQRQVDIRPLSHTLGRRLYADSPRDFTAWMRACWKAWQAESTADADCEQGVAVRICDESCTHWQ